MREQQPSSAEVLVEQERVSEQARQDEACPMHEVEIEQTFVLQQELWTAVVWPELQPSRSSATEVAHELEVLVLAVSYASSITDLELQYF
jgi:hypothetical protein